MRTKLARNSLIASASLLLIAGCDRIYSINGKIQFEGSITLDCVELSALNIGLEASRGNDIYNRPLEEYIVVRIRDRRGTSSSRLGAEWLSLEPQIFNLSYHRIGSSESRRYYQEVCDLMSEYTESFATHCGNGQDTTAIAYTFNGTSCVIEQ